MRRATLTILVVSLLALTGCGGGNPKPKALPSKSSESASSSPTASPSAPTIPTAAHRKDKRGALEMAKAFISAVNYSGATGDSKPLRAMYISYCTRCEALADAIDSTYAAGGSFKGGDWTPTSSKFYAIDGDVAFLDVLVDTAPQVWIQKSGSEPKNFKASRDILKAFNLRWVNSAWRVSALDPDR